MSPKSRKHIFNQLFDVRPMKEDGSLHLEKIYSVKKCLNLKEAVKRKQRNNIEKIQKDGHSQLPDGRSAREVFAPILTNYYQAPLKTRFLSGGPIEEKSNNESIKINLAIDSKRQEIYQELAGSGVLDQMIYQQKATSPRMSVVEDRQKIISDLEMILSGKPEVKLASSESLPSKKDDFWEVIGRHNLDNLGNREKSSQTQDVENIVPDQENENIAGEQQISLHRKKSSLSRYAILASFFVVMILGGMFVRSSLNSKDLALEYAALASEEMLGAKDDLKNLDFKSASAKFDSASKNFQKSKDSIGRFNYFFLSAASGLPFVSSSKLSGVNLIDAGEYLAKTGEMLSRDMEAFSSVSLKNVFEPNGKSELLVAINNLENDLDRSLSYVILARKNVEKTDDAVLPDGISKKDLIEKIEQAKSSIVDGREYVDMVSDLIGAKRPKEYLVLFQNPSEIRATGGFVGSYGIVKLDDGKIKKILVDDIFNPDGQLRERIVPPFPIQKISTAWSMHDANWFFDFPTSAQKVAWFYEKTGGPSVDAVITLNPFVIEKLLDVTGPIEMPEYDTVIVSENFVDAIQYEVEEGDNKKENKPKKILADFMPKFLEKLLSKKDNLPQIIKVLSESAKSKDIMAYSFDDKMQKIISGKGFSGGVIKGQDDYLAVVSSNINGYKTDRMIDGSINLKSEIDADGYVVNTLTVKKSHTGGSSQYDFYNQVNADYLRVYVPEGSMLIDAKGHTIDKNKAPVDYEKLAFKKDDDVVATESSMIIDEKTKTQIYKESGKTVFANWVFVSPKEDVEVVYKYRLPQRFDFGDEYGIVFQKQSGSKMKLNWSAVFPNNIRLFSQDEMIRSDKNTVELSSDFKSDTTINLRTRGY